MRGGVLKRDWEAKGGIKRTTGDIVDHLRETCKNSGKTTERVRRSRSLKSLSIWGEE